MKALTICQPYAELIARREKPIENRTWETTYRGWLAIHAGKSREWMGDDDERNFPDMAFGAFVAVARVVACLEYEDRWPSEWVYLHNHEHANGPWCWILDDIRRLPSPIPYRGAQGLWLPSPAVLPMLKEATIGAHRLAVQ